MRVDDRMESLADRERAGPLFPGSHAGGAQPGGIRDADSRRTVLCVEDSPESMTILHVHLKPRYRVRMATSGEQALKIAFDEAPDLILLDIVMPGMDGYDVCRRLKADPRTRHVPVIFLTARSAAEDEQLGFSIGAIDYITKPISPPTLMARVEAYAELAASQRSLRDQNMRLEVRVRERTREIESMQDAMTIAMSSLCETRGNETGNHIRRIRNYVRTLATNLQQRTAFADVLKDEYVHLLYQTAPLYDIGKVGVPDEILLKPQRHTPGEFDVMKLHVDYGLQTLECIELELGTSNAFLETAKEIVACHHERWDGSGYPRGLRGHAIPVSARLMAVADVYDALVSKRVYKSTIPHPEAVKLIEAGGGRQFDPDVVDAFVEVADQFAKIATQYED